MMEQKKVLITANNSPWHSANEALATRAISSLLKKHRDAIVITAHQEIARIAHSLGVPVHMFFQKTSEVSELAIDICDNITVLSLPSIIAKNEAIVNSADYVIAIDDGDPVAIIAMRSSKGVWFPRSGRVVENIYSN